MASGNKNTSRKNSSKKTNTKSSTSKKRAQEIEEQEERNTVIYQDVILCLVIAITVLLFISNFGLGGVGGDFIAGILFGLFGLLNYIFPVVLVIAVFFYFSNRNNNFAKRKLIYGAVFYVFLCMLIELITHGENQLGLRGAYIYGLEYHKGGGFFGGIFSNFFMSAFGSVGSYIFCFLVLVLMFILMSERSGVETFLKERQKYRERKREREEQERLEEENRIEVVKVTRDRNVPEEEKYDHDITSSVHNGRRKRKVRVQVLTDDPEAERLDRHAKGVTLNTKLEPDVSDLKKSSSDEISEITDASLHSMDDNSVVHQIDSYDLDSRDQNEPEVDLYNEPTSSWKQDSEEMLRTVYEDKYESEPDEPGDTYTEPEIQYRETHSLDSDAIKRTAGPAVPTASGNGNTSTSNTSTEGTTPATPVKVKRPYVYPTVDLLKQNKKNGQNSARTLQETADRLKNTLNNFGIRIDGEIQYVCGPTVTRYEFKPEVGVKLSKITNLTDDIKMNLAATDIRVEAPVPGRDVVGIEVPNKETAVVGFRELMETPEFKASKSKIAFAAGKDIGGKTIISDIAKMPHLLIAGSTGSGKSVCINTIIMSILYHANPDEVKFIMIDPKVVELSVYNGIPHLLIPVVTDPKKASAALQWAVNEMTDRYKKFADTGVRDMAGYNAKIHDGKITVVNNGEKTDIAAKKMPQLVVIVDELADLMMVSSNEVEASICRLAQLARAAGIHLVIATQRPSVDVITGLIKANMPSRIAFAVTSGTDSRTILDMVGAEKLLGKGDMLYYPQGLSKPIRVQGAFVSDDEVSNVVKFITTHNDSDYDDEAEEKLTQSMSMDGAVSIEGTQNGFSDSKDEYFAESARLIIGKEKGSIGMLQRNFKIGFNRAARIMDQLEEFGVVGPEEGTKPRRVLVTEAEFEEMLSREE